MKISQTLRLWCVFLLVLLYTIPIGSSPLFSDDFERTGDKNQWLFSNDDSLDIWFKTGASFGCRSNGGVRVVAGVGHLFGKNGLWTTDSDLFRKGFYFKFNMRINALDTGSLLRPGQFVEIFHLIMLGASGKYYSNPALILMRGTNGNIFPRMHIRQKKGDFSLFIPATDNITLAPGQWHSFSIFFRLRNQVVSYALVIDEKILGSGDRNLLDSVGLMQSWRLGAEQPDTGKCVESIDFDDISIMPASDQTDTLSNQGFCPFSYQAIPASMLEFTGDPSITDTIDSVQVKIILDNSAIKDSTFASGVPRVFHERLAQGIYFYQERFFNRENRGNHHVFGGPWLVTEDSTITYGKRNKNNFIRLINPPPNHEYAEGDTMVFELNYTPQQGQTNIDFNLRSISFKYGQGDRFGAFEKSSNYVFAFWRQNDRIVYKTSQGDHEWKLAVKDSTKDSFPLTAFDFNGYAPDPSTGKTVVAFRATRDMVPGIWTVNATLLIIDGAILENFPSVYFTVKPARTPLLLAVTIGILVLLTLIFGLFLIFKRNKTATQPTNLPPSWKKAADTAEAYLREHFADQELDSQRIADHLKMSDRNIRKIYMEAKGKALFQHLREIRFEKACELLKTTDQNVSEIGYDVGFSDPVIFQRNFKKMCGKTPSEYRNQNQ